MRKALLLIDGRCTPIDSRFFYARDIGLVGFILNNAIGVHEAY
ncbi:MAG: hypothetical protein PHH38_05610 [Candidatus Cloacimonetes bacterium]|nr:hypothetical protein [Candidatus Cloacimonadota bacterium]